MDPVHERGSMDAVHERGSMDPVHILMDPVHAPGPRRGSMDQACFVLSRKILQHGDSVGAKYLDLQL